MKHFLIGLISGFIAPLLFGWLFMLGFYHGDLSISSALIVMKSNTMLMKLLFVGLTPNLFAVFLLTHFEKWNICRGVFVTIMLYIAVAVII
ncbi:MAG: hypothetical protein LBS50_01240 [Prevotellaceae bacterium]|jgi:hypothetical protein|nr:hypothetical protein [Prevotellaceae bacterium]